MIFNKLLISRWAIVLLMFCCIFQVQGIASAREAQQLILMLSMICLSSLLIQNIWITLFILWTVFLFCFFKFTTGSGYLSNIFFGLILYYFARVSFKKEHLNFFIEGFLWFVWMNIAYCVVQVCGYDFIFEKTSSALTTGFIHYSPNLDPVGFMGNKSVMACLLAFSIPLVASRGSRISLLTAMMLFIPLYLCQTSLCFVAGGVGLLFVLFYRIKMIVWTMVLLSLIILGGCYIKKVDSFGTERFNQWYMTLRHWTIHPLTGWGPDSFANITKNKDFLYLASTRDFEFAKDNVGVAHGNIRIIEYWDNPHNLIVSLLYEFGLIGLVLFIGYNVRNVLLFLKSVKSNDVLGFSGFILVVLTVSMGHFPLWLAREACFIVPAFAMFETAVS